MRLFLLGYFLYITLPVLAQTAYQPSAENLAARKTFQDNKFGMFIHWGVYSILGDGEWVMNNRQISAKDYEKLPTFFNPIAFDAKEWVSIAKNAGMKYITITSKHHDGFAMYDSKVSDYDIVDRTPYKKDVLKALADECRAQGIKLFFYHSHLDWHHPDYYPRGRTGQKTGRPESGNFENYLKYMDTQLTELLTNYGPVGGIWFDGWWDQSADDAGHVGNSAPASKTGIDWHLDRTYSLIHKLQPAALIGNNHHVAPFPGEDFQMFEKDLPGSKTTGFNEAQTIGQLPLETCETMNGAWGFNIKDNHYKSTKELIQYLVKAAGHNANFLLNVGPMPNGKIQPEFVKTLGEIGQWTQQNGETIYGTRSGPVPARNWGVTTAVGNRVFVHILDWSDRQLTLPAIPGKVRSAKLFADKSIVKVSQTPEGVVLTMATAPADDAMDTIIELEMNSETAKK
ncbi:alpha-L-fucosidase [Spirosoma sp. KCTC 42546]|uniref:alpha-L-fucosidase n=1 Tax=Spirosoma sp. KCTC 42546 TaxID=2520506 RepID=UPI0011591695|nr:alpha-L-fucosidase [Spirosoma sp. KCTC 42546]QDK82284.1 alpha-L-fucosidase [Spirosoma sp. KCTC 42546]